MEVFVLADIPEILTAFSSLMGVIIGTIEFVHTYLVTKVRGPQLAIPEARVQWRKEDHLQVKAVIQNIGDRLMYLRFEIVRIKLPDGSVIVSQQDEYENNQFQPITQIPKGFTFRIPSDVDLTGGYFVINVWHSTLDETMVAFEKRKLLSGKVEPISKDSEPE